MAHLGSHHGVAGLVDSHRVALSFDVLDILGWAQQRIAPYKCPRRVFVMPDLPFTFSIKPKRFEVRERIVKLLENEE